MFAEYTDLKAAAPDVEPARAGRLLWHASLLVSEAVRFARYDVDADGAPTSPAVTTALREATVAQALAWARAGIDPDDPGSTGPQRKQSVTLGGASVSYAGAVEQVAAVAAARDSLVPAAALVLRAAGLVSHVRVV